MRPCLSCTGCVGGRGGKERQTILFLDPHMPTFEIPTGPSITKRGTTYLVSQAKMCCGKRATTDAPYGSITYDREKGRMPLEWENEDKFLVWLAAEEHVQTIKLIVSVTEESDSPNWRAQRTYRCSREFSGGKQDQENKHEWDWKIPSMKTGCQCRLIIKKYPQTETILGKYDGCYGYTKKDLDSAVVTMQAKSSISHGLIV
jgi:hypothetical protein